MQLSKLKHLLKDLPKPLLEIAGPTTDGYEFLKHLSIQLPSDLHISNVSKTIVIDPYGDNPKTYVVDEAIDIRNKPNKKEYYGTILCSGLTLDPGQVINFKSEDEKHSYWEIVKPQVLQEYENAINSKNDSITFKLNQHIALFVYASLALKPGGLLIFQHIMHEDNEVASRLGLKQLLTKNLENKFDTQIYQKL
jgi:hypothetical protein